MSTNHLVSFVDIFFLGGVRWGVASYSYTMDGISYAMEAKTCLGLRFEKF